MDATCRDRPESAFYQTWTALQQHIRTTHPPTCPHDECAGRTFSAQKGLRAHLRLHDQRAIEEHEHASSEDEDDALPRKRRRGGDMGRDWKCEVDGCTKDFKSVRHVDFFFVVVFDASALVEKSPYDPPCHYSFGKTGFCLYGGGL